jgi:hypothetical protein
MDAMIGALLGLRDDLLPLLDESGTHDRKRLQHRASRALSKYEDALALHGSKLTSVTAHEVVWGVSSAVRAMREWHHLETDQQLDDYASVVVAHIEEVVRWMPECRWKETFLEVPRSPWPETESVSEGAVVIGLQTYMPGHAEPRRDSALGSEWAKVVRRFKRAERRRKVADVVNRTTIWRRSGDGQP